MSFCCSVPGFCSYQPPLMNRLSAHSLICARLYESSPLGRVSRLRARSPRLGPRCWASTRARGDVLREGFENVQVVLGPQLIGPQRTLQRIGVEPRPPQRQVPGKSMWLRTSSRETEFAVIAQTLPTSRKPTHGSASHQAFSAQLETLAAQQFTERLPCRPRW